ncbi:MAG: polysaccharide deacetylase family protein [Rhodospirillales bacterium]|nr:polysaccharide deacetylase family protein [Rhodospirillales bacterium]
MQRRALMGGLLASPALAENCRGTLYLTIDTGWSREAEQLAEVLRRREVRATLFLAQEPSFRGDRTLDASWAPFWRARAAEGHVFASHTWRHWYFSGDAGPGRTRYVSRRQEGGEVLDQAALCAELARPLEALRAMVPEAPVLPLWRAPGGIVTGFLGDELSSETHPNAALLRRNLDKIRDGEVLVMHWGVRSRREPFAEIFDALIGGLQARGFCFRPLPPHGA